THLAFHHSVLARAVRRCSCVDGRRVWFLEQRSVDDQRALRHRSLRRCTMKPDFSRRRMLTGLMAGAGVAMLAGCDRMTQSTQFGALLRNTEKLTMSSQRLLLGRQSLAREY